MEPPYGHIDTFEVHKLETLRHLEEVIHDILTLSHLPEPYRSVAAICQSVFHQQHKLVIYNIKY